MSELEQIAKEKHVPLDIYVSDLFAEGWHARSGNYERWENFDYHEAFREWLAAHDAEVAAQALEDAAVYILGISKLSIHEAGINISLASLQCLAAQKRGA